MIIGVASYIYVGLYIVVFAMCAVALVDAATRKSRAFVDAGKRTKGFWVGVLATATAVAFVAIPQPIGIGQLSAVALASAVAGGIYFADVKPAVVRYSGGNKRPGAPRGGW